MVDFGIFGSIAGIRMENITCGSLRYMAPELLQGNTLTSTKIDIWSLGIMLNVLGFGFFPVNSKDMEALKQQVVNQELDYKTLKRIKPSSIKNEMRKHMNSLLRKTSDDLIDLIEQMLCKNMG